MDRLLVGKCGVVIDSCGGEGTMLYIGDSIGDEGTVLWLGWQS